MDNISLHCLLLLLILSKLAHSAFVDRNRVKYFSQSRLRALRTGKKSLELNCSGLAINLLSVQETCNGNVISSTSKFLDECDNKPYCTLNFGCEDGIINSTVHYTCRGLDPVDITDKSLSSAFFRDNSLASLRCGDNRYVFISSAFYIHDFSEYPSENDTITDDVKNECDYGGACSFIPKLLPGIKKVFKDSYVYVTFLCILDKLACSTFYCEDNSTCVIDGPLPPKCVCNKGYIMKNGHCVKDYSVKPIPIGQRPSWGPWRGGIPDPLGKLNNLPSDDTKLKIPHSKSGFNYNVINKFQPQPRKNANSDSETNNKDTESENTGEGHSDDTEPDDQDELNDKDEETEPKSNTTESDNEEETNDAESDNEPENIREPETNDTETNDEPGNVGDPETNVDDESKSDSETDAESESESEYETGDEGSNVGGTDQSENEQDGAVESNGAEGETDGIGDNRNTEDVGGTRDGKFHFHGNLAMQPDFIRKGCFLNTDRIIVFEISCKNKTCEYKYKECYNISN